MPDPQGAALERRRKPHHERPDHRVAFLGVLVFDEELPGRTDQQRVELRPERTAGGKAELVVVWPLKDFTCSSCGAERDGLLIMEASRPVCMECAELDHLVFLPSGDAPLTRRAKKRMASEIRRLFPGCPPARAQQIAIHAATRGSGRVSDLVGPGRRRAGGQGGLGRSAAL